MHDELTQPPGATSQPYHMGENMFRQHMANGINDHTYNPPTWRNMKAVCLVVKVDVHDSWGCIAQRWRQNALPVRQLAVAEVTKLLTPVTGV
jgi:hypothetical protein